MNIDNNSKKHCFLVIVILILTIFARVITKFGCSSKEKILGIVYLLTYIIYLIKFVLLFKFDLMIKEPMSTYGKELLSDVFFLINTLLFIDVNKSEKIEECIWVVIFTFIGIFIIKSLEFIISKDGKELSIYSIFVFVFSRFNKENMEIITIFTTLFTTAFGRIVIKNVFGNQIIDYEKNQGKEKEDILDKLEYKLMKGNILLIIAHLIIFLTERFRGTCTYKHVLDLIGLKDKYFIGLLRLAIISAVYVFSISKFSIKIKNLVFNFLIKERKRIERR